VQAAVAEAGEHEPEEVRLADLVGKAAELEMAEAAEAVDRVVVDQVAVAQAPAGVAAEAVEGAVVEVEAVVDGMRCRSSWPPVVGVAAAVVVEAAEVAVDLAVGPVAQRPAAVEGLEAQLLLVEALRAAPAHRQVRRCCKSLRRRCLRLAPSRL